MKEKGSYADKNNDIDAILINLLSDEDKVAVEIRVDRVAFMIVSTYFDINRPIYINLQKIQALLTQAKGMWIILAIDSNARSTLWKDVLTNKRGKKLEELIISEQLHKANAESSSYTFQAERGASIIDLTVLNTQAVDNIKDWAIHEQESCSDHKIIIHEIGKGINLRQQTG